MSQPSNDDFSQHLSDEESNHEDASRSTGAMGGLVGVSLGAPKLQRQGESSNNLLSQISKLPIPAARGRGGKGERFKLLKGKEGEEYFADGHSQRTYEKIGHGMIDSKVIWEVSTLGLVEANSKENAEAKVLVGFADEVIYSLFAKQSEDWDLLHEYAKQINDVDIEVHGHKILANSNDCYIRMKKFSKKTGRRVRYHFARERTQRGTHDGKEEERLIVNNIKKTGKQGEKYRWSFGPDRLCNMMVCDYVNWERTSQKRDRTHKSCTKVGLGFEIKSNNEVLSYEEEMNFSVFKCSKEDSIGKPSYSRFTKTNDFKGVPHPLSGDYSPKPQEEIDDSMYVYGKKGPQKPEISVSDENSSEHSTCQSNDSEGSCGNTSEHSFETESESLDEPNEMSKSKLEVTNEKDVSAPKSKEVEPSCVSHIKTPRQPLKDNETHKVNRKNWNDMMERELGEGYSFTKKKCFVCGSLSHLIKDCDYYEKKMAREAEVKRVFNTGNGVAKPVWTKANRVNHANKFVPRSVQLNAGRPKFNSVRPNINTGWTNINSGRPKVNTVSSKVNTVRTRQPIPHKTSNSLSPKRPQMNQINQRRDFSKSYSSVRRPFAKSTAQMAHSNAVMGSWGSAVKTSASYNWRNSRPNFNYNSGPTFIRTVNANGPQGRPKRRNIH
ncbi:hypothetical protein Tco_1139214 [Tanacetum coccineum]